MIGLKKMLINSTTNPKRLRFEYGKEVSDCYLILNSSIVGNKYIQLAYSITDSLGITSHKKRNQAIAKTVENAIKALNESIEMKKDMLYDKDTKKVSDWFMQINTILGTNLEHAINQHIHEIKLHELARGTLEMIAERLKEGNNETYPQNKSLEEAIKIAKEGLPYIACDCASTHVYTP